ncbi:hypothetical protein OQH38_18380, partial [Acinetobacter baumannii]|nr:hypothetical protein [Acinetobacter baumannii]
VQLYGGRSFRRRGGTQGCPQKRKSFSCALGIRPVKVDWQCGQQAKDSALPYYSQAHKMTFVLN